MNDKDMLENTMPIKPLNEVSKNQETRAERNATPQEEQTREDKYKECLENDIAAQIERDAEEAAEEALAEKNIAMAESLLHEEKKEENLIQEEENKKENPIKKLIEKFKSLPKKQRIFIIVGGILLLILLIVGILFLIIHSPKKEKEEGEESKPEETPVIVDNFYYKEGSLHFLDANGEEIGTYTCQNKDKDLCYVAINSYRDSFDVDMVLTEEEEEKVQRLPIVNDDYVFIVDKEKEKDTVVYLYSIESEKVEEEYTDAKGYDGNSFVIRDAKGNYGLIKIEKTVKEVIKPTYKYLGKIDKQENLIALKTNGYVVVNEEGKELSSVLPPSTEIKSYSDTLLVTKSGTMYSVLNYRGDALITNAEFANVDGKYMAYVVGNKVYVRDSDKNKYHEEGISLKNKEYVKKYIYNEKGKLIETKASFTMDTSGEEVELVVFDENGKNTTYTRFSKIAVVVNAKYPYINYFDGKLYFYKEVSKDTLLGSYTCNNKNTINDKDSEFSSCYVAKDTIFDDNDAMRISDKERHTTIPLINNKFVFIQDGTNTIHLYNLVSKESIGPYEAVNTYLPDNEYTFGMYNGTVQFIALNKKGKYGMVSLNADGASSVYTFNYNKLEKLGNYVIAQNSENKWQALYSASETSSSFDGKIQEISNDKKYYKISSGDSYMIYSNSGSPISKETYLKAKLYTSFYVGITQSKNLYIYDYSGNTITKEAVSVNNLTCSIGDLFKVEASGTNYSVSLCEGDHYTVYTPSTTIVEPSDEGEE